MSRDRIKSGRASFIEKISPGSKTLDRLDTFAALFSRWQAKINLVSEQTVGDLWSRHILDSAQLYQHIPRGVETLIDIGTGGGFPGLILAFLATEGGGPAVTLIESNVRKAVFLREASRVCEIPVEIINARAEKANVLMAEVVTARACAPFSRLLPLIHCCLKPNGVGLLLKGASWRDELTVVKKDWTMNLVEVPSITDASGVILKLEGLKPS